MVVVIKRGPLGGWSTSYLRSENENWVQIPGWHDTPEKAKLAAFDALNPG
jgi:hypothetical protein